tara:strand:+ start:822 stop:1037 length:216 start_codon:yes stop_codon:yes gene_type:complete
MDQERPSSRSLIGMLGMILGLSAYAFGAAAIGDMISHWPLAITSVYYLIAGIAWLYPAIKILRWMAAGHHK